MDIQWKDEVRSISQLKGWEKNPRKIRVKERLDLKKSLSKFGLAETITVNLDNTIISGHQRVAILEDLFGSGFEVRVSVPNRMLEEAEIAELAIRMNKNQGEFDMSGLAEFDSKMLEDVGFSSAELNRIFMLDFDKKVEGEENFVPELREENNYVVFVFDNDIDWLAVSQKLNLTTVNALDSRKGYIRQGIGRVLKGSVLLRHLDKL